MRSRVRPVPNPLGDDVFDAVAVRPAPASRSTPRGTVRSPFNVRVNARDGDPLGHVQSEVTLAVRGDTLVVGWNDAAGYGGAASLSGYGTSTDGGRSWRDGGEVPNGPLTRIAGDPSVVVLPDGTWVFGSVDLGNDDGVAIHRGRFEGGVLEWEPPRLYLREGGEALDKPALAVDPESGTLYLAYVNWSQNRGEVSRSDDGGRTWSEPLVVHESSRASGYTPTPGLDGELYVAWTDRLGATGTTHLVRHSTDGGRSWSTPPRALVTLDPGAHNPPLCFNREVNATFVDLAVDRGAGPTRGRVYAVWTDGHPGAFDVFLSASADGARSFTAPVRLNDNLNAATTESFWPVVDIASDGRLTVGWYDRRNGDPSDEISESLCDFYVTQSRDGGASFGPNRRMSTMSVAWCGVPADLVPNFGDYVDLVTVDSAVLATWADARAGDPDVTFGRIDDHQPLVVELRGTAGDTRRGRGAVWTIADEVTIGLEPTGEPDVAVMALATGLLGAPPDGSVLLAHGERLRGSVMFSTLDGTEHATFTLARTPSGRVLLTVNAGERIDPVRVDPAPIEPLRGHARGHARYRVHSMGGGDAAIEGTLALGSMVAVRVSGHLSFDGTHPSAGVWSIDQEIALEPSDAGPQLRTRSRVSVRGPALPTAATADALARAQGARQARKPFPAASITASGWRAGIPVTFRVGVSADSWAPIRIYDASGRCVRELPARRLTPGRHDIPFDGRDGAGRPLAPGVYFLELATHHLRARGKLVIR